MNDQTNEIQTPEYVFKVLSGSLNGIEFNLGAYSHFICTGDAKVEHGNLAYAEQLCTFRPLEPGKILS